MSKPTGSFVLSTGVAIDGSNVGTDAKYMLRTVLRKVQQASQTSRFPCLAGAHAGSMRSMHESLFLLVTLAGAGIAWKAWARGRRQRALREAMAQLRVARRLGRCGHVEPAGQYANDVLEQALRERDALREA